jgi:2'-5' RNA ligase
VTPLRRAFVAVEPPGVVLDAIESLADRLRDDHPSLRWTNRAQWHVTLQFLGRVEAADAITSALADAVATRGPSRVRLGGGGGFPKPARASVLWLGVVQGAKALGDLSADVGAAASSCGAAPDERPFRPHVTLARARAGADVRALLDVIGEGPVGPAWTIDEVVLFSSDTRPEGARYTAVRRIPLSR